RTVRTEQVILPDDLGEFPGAQPVGQRTRRVLIEPRGFKQAWAAFGPRAHRQNVTVIDCPPRMMVTRHWRWRSLATRSRSRVRAIFSSFTCAITSPRWKPRFWA